MGGVEVSFPSLLQSEEQTRRTTMFPTADEVERFWKSKAGYCHGCDSPISIDEQYCDSCREFLLEAETLTTREQ